jgi:hypothetical protein
MAINRCPGHPLAEQLMQCLRSQAVEKLGIVCAVQYLPSVRWRFGGVVVHGQVSDNLRPKPTSAPPHPDFEICLRTSATWLPGLPTPQKNGKVSGGLALCLLAQEGIHVMLRLACVEGLAEFRHTVFDRGVERHRLPPAKQALLLAQH